MTVNGGTVTIRQREQFTVSLSWSLKMAWDNSKAATHVCIYAMERDRGSFTGDVVCTVCGAKLSSADQTPKEGANPEHPPHLDRPSDR